MTDRKLTTEQRKALEKALYLALVNELFDEECDAATFWDIREAVANRSNDELIADAQRHGIPVSKEGFAYTLTMDHEESDWLTNVLIVHENVTPIFKVAFYWEENEDDSASIRVRRLEGSHNSYLISYGHPLDIGIAVYNRLREIHIESGMRHDDYRAYFRKDGTGHPIAQPFDELVNKIIDPWK